MKIKVFGFKFAKAKLPKAMTATDVFLQMEKTPGMHLGKNYRYSAHKITVPIQGQDHEWWGGMILKLRDSAAFTKLTEVNGKTVLTAQKLAGNEKLVELTYFVAFAATGSGILAHHYHGTSLTSFALGSAKIFRQAQSEAVANAVKGKTPKERKIIHQDYKGKLALEQLCNDTNLKALVKELKRVSTFELKLATLETKETFLRGIIEKASHESLKLTFPEDTDVDGLADDAATLTGIESVTDIKVTGYDSNKVRREFHKSKNPLIFHEFDYDEVTQGLNIDFDDWAGSIANSEMIKKMITVASTPSTLKLLKVV